MRAGRESWLRAVARRACLPVAVVERVLWAALGLGLDPATTRSTEFASAVRDALEAHRRREAEELHRVVLAADRTRAIGACGTQLDAAGGAADLIVIRGGKG